MPVTVLIPTPLRKLTGDQETISSAPGTLAGLIDELDARFPGLGGRLTDEAGNLRKFVNVYVNEEDVRFLAGKETEIKDGDTVSIVPAIAGG